jgi:hypothetical protein
VCHDHGPNEEGNVNCNGDTNSEEGGDTKGGWYDWTRSWHSRLCGECGGSEPNHCELSCVGGKAVSLLAMHNTKMAQHAHFYLASAIPFGLTLLVACVWKWLGGWSTKTVEKIKPEKKVFRYFVRIAFSNETPMEGEAVTSWKSPTTSMVGKEEDELDESVTEEEVATSSFLVASHKEIEVPFVVVLDEPIRTNLVPLETWLEKNKEKWIKYVLGWKQVSFIVKELSPLVE